MGCLLLVAVALSAWNYRSHGVAGVFAASLAWLLCTSAAVAALVVSVRFAGTEHALSANLGGMGLRMGVPLFAMTVLPNALPELAAAGLLHSILILYLVSLALETVLAVRHVPPNPVKPKPDSRTSSTPGKPLEIS